MRNEIQFDFGSGHKDRTFTTLELSQMLEIPAPSFAKIKKNLGIVTKREIVNGKVNAVWTYEDYMQVKAYKERFDAQQIERAMKKSNGKPTQIKRSSLVTNPNFFIESYFPSKEEITPICFKEID